MANKKRNRTAAEVLAELSADPDFVAREREEEQFRARYEAELREAEAPLAKALRAVGFPVDSAWELYKHEPYPEAVPILLEHLQRPYPDRVREGIARALEVPEAIEGWETLRHLFEADSNASTQGSKWAIGCALSAAATDAVIGDVIRLAEDPKHGNNRLALFSALERSADPRARETLIELSTDPTFEYEAKKSLKRLDRKKGGGAKREESASNESLGELSEASMNFDSDLVEPFLRELSTLVSSFSAADVATITRMLDELEADGESELRFEVDFQKERTPLRIRVFMDDIDAPDLYFFTSPALAEEINELMQNFSAERGL